VLLSIIVAVALGAALVAFAYVALRDSVATVALVIAAWIATAALRDMAS
jgi:hypothetical protein